jgi:membrane protease YdiL (CAAX protease family)
LIAPRTPISESKESDSKFMPDTLPADPRQRHRELWLETSAVTICCVGPMLFNSMASLYLIDRPGHYSFLYHALASLVRSAGSIAIVLLVIWRSKDPFTRFGIKPFRIGHDLLGGIALWAILWLITLSYRAVVHKMFGASYLAYHSTPMSYSLPSSVTDYLLLVVYSFANGSFEELLMRAYLITRLEELLDSTSTALIITTAIFASYHGYQGGSRAILVIILGLLQGLWFCFGRRFAPLAIAHSLQDIAALAVNVH